MTSVTLVLGGGGRGRVGGAMSAGQVGTAPIASAPGKIS